MTRTYRDQTERHQAQPAIGTDTVARLTDLLSARG